MANMHQGMGYEHNHKMIKIHIYCSFMTLFRKKNEQMVHIPSSQRRV